MSSTPPEKPAGMPSLKDLIFTKNEGSSIADRVKSFLPQIAKANEDLANIEADDREAVIIEDYESSSSSDDSDSDSDESETSDAPESQGKKKWDKGDHISIDVYKYAEKAEVDEPGPSDAKKSKPNEEEEDEDDFTIRLATDKPQK